MYWVLILDIFKEDKYGNFNLNIENFMQDIKDYNSYILKLYLKPLRLY